MIAWPLHSPTSTCPTSNVHILSIIKSVQSKTAAPRQPTGGINQTVDRRFHDHCSRILFPRSTQVVFTGAFTCDTRVVNNYTRVFVWVFSSLRCDSVLLVAFPDVNIAVLKHHHSVAEYEVLGSINVAVAIELSFSIDI